MSRAGLDLLPAQSGEKEKYYQPDSWMPRHNLVCQLHAIGMKNREIAAAIGYSEPKISFILHDPRAKTVIQNTLEEMASNIMDLHTRLKVHAVEALDEIVNELRSSKDERIKQRAAFGILDRAGYTPVQRQVVLGATIGEEIATRIEKAHSKMQTIDAEYEVVNHHEAKGEES